MKRKLQVLLWVLVAAWMGLIFFFSAQDAQTSSGQSGGLIRWILEWLDPAFETMSQATQESHIEMLQHVVRKFTHMSVYAVLGALCMTALCTYRLREKIRLLLAWGISALYAASDEFHQTFIPGRSGELRDVLIDSTGAILGILVVWMVWRFLVRRKTMKSGS